MLRELICYCWNYTQLCAVFGLIQQFALCHMWETNQTLDTFCCCVNTTCHLCTRLVSNADSQNGLLSLLPAALKWSLHWSQPGDSEWKGYCMWPYMSSWGGPAAICTQKWYEAKWLNLEEELHSVCSVGSERTIFSKGLGRSCAVFARRC